MGLHQSNDAKAYFKHLKEGGKYGKLDDRGEQYFICLMIGIINEKIAPEIGPSEEIMVRGWSEGLKSNKYEILGAVLAQEVKRLTLPADSSRYNKIMLKYLSSDDGGLFNLTKDGVELFDKYSEGGFKLVKMNIPEPRDKDLFLFSIYEEFLS